MGKAMENAKVIGFPWPNSLIIYTSKGYLTSKYASAKQQSAFIYKKEQNLQEILTPLYQNNTS